MNSSTKFSEMFNDFMSANSWNTATICSSTIVIQFYSKFIRIIEIEKKKNLVDSS